MEAAYRHALGRPHTAEHGFDELVRASGHSAETWSRLGMTSWTDSDLRRVREATVRLLEDDGVFHTPLSDAPAVTGTAAARATPWRLDPVPIVVPPEDWSWLERGVEQRARLLEKVLDDLYGARRLLTSGLVPPELLWRWSGQLRPAWGAQPSGRPRLVLTGHDLGRGSEGTWRVITDRTQSPRGLGYAAENRRVTARVLPEAFRGTEVRRLSGFFDRIRAALTDLAPAGVEDPRVVVLTPGHGSSGFDQAQLASLLGLPLVTGDDLTVDRGRLWSRDVSGEHPVDVVVRRVPEQWCDPLELRPDSRLGVPGLLSAARRGSVVLANALGSGLVESPALGAILADLAEPLIDEPLALPSAPAWWCGDPAGLSHVLSHLESMVLRPVDPSHAEVVVGSALTRSAREQWTARLREEAGAWVGQEQLPLSTSPTVARLGLEPRRISMRLFAVAREGSYAVLPGGLGRVVPDRLDPSTRRRDRVAVSKDVWVTSAAATPATVAPPRAERTLLRGAASVPVVPRALEQLFWIGRYAERAEAQARLVLAISSLADETSYRLHSGGPEVISRLTSAMEQLSLDERPQPVGGPFPGPRAPGLPDRVDATLRDLMVDHGRDGSLSATLNELLDSAGAVRDQLSGDVFVVLGDMERACTDLEEIGTARLATPADGHDQWRDGRTHRKALGAQVRETARAALTGSLALTGITAENMVRDTGWHVLEAGRAMERALQTITMVDVVFARRVEPEVERALVHAVLLASESVVTHRRRYAGRVDFASLVELLLLDPGNPRSVAYGLRRLRVAMEALPRTAASTRIIGEVESAAGVLGARGATSLAQARDGAPADGQEPADPLRQDLVAVTEIVIDCLRRLSGELATAYFRHAGPPQQLGYGLAPSAPWSSGQLGRDPREIG